jgi:hypothetical protein
MHAKSHHFRSLTFQSFTSSFHCSLHGSHSMLPWLRRLLTIEKLFDDSTKSDSEVESVAPTTSSPTPVVIMMADGKIPKMSDFFKKTTITKEEHKAYHDLGRLPGNLISTIPEVDVPTVHDSSMICFESHLITGLGVIPGFYAKTEYSSYA